jgi:hypothetical protein
VFWCSSSRDALAFAHFGFSSHCNVFLATLETMCHLSLGVCTDTLSVCLFVYLLVLFCLFAYFVCFVYNFFFVLLCC